MEMPIRAAVADAPAKGQGTARHMMLAALVAHLMADARSGRAALYDWRCAQLDELALRLTRDPETEVDAALVAALVCGTEDDCLLSESALQAVVQQVLLVLEPAWKITTTSGALLPLACKSSLHWLM